MNRHTQNCFPKDTCIWSWRRSKNKDCFIRIEISILNDETVLFWCLESWSLYWTGPCWQTVTKGITDQPYRRRYVDETEYWYIHNYYAMTKTGNNRNYLEAWYVLTCISDKPPVPPHKEWLFQLKPKHHWAIDDQTGWWTGLELFCIDWVLIYGS